MRDLDCLAWSDSDDPNNLVLEFPIEADGKFRPIGIPGISQGSMEVPSHGISISGNIYIVHTTDWHHPEDRIDPRGNMERSVMACSRDDGKSWNYLYDLSSAKNHDMTNAKFINVSVSKVQADQYPDMLPYTSGDIVLIWGSGAYRKSNPSLACIPSKEIESKEALRFFYGFGQDGKPTWSLKESDSLPLFDDTVIGELSTAWLEELGVWVMLYNSPMNPRGVRLRTAHEPWGPYSDASVILDTEVMQKEGWVAAYGPYIVSRFTSGDRKRCQIYYTVSAWKPYQTFLVSSEMGVTEEHIE